MDLNARLTTTDTLAHQCNKADRLSLLIRFPCCQGPTEGETGSKDICFCPSHNLKNGRWLRPCKIFGCDLTKMFHVKHFGKVLRSNRTNFGSVTPPGSGAVGAGRFIAGQHFIIGEPGLPLLDRAIERIAVDIAVNAGDMPLGGMLPEMPMASAVFD